ncbi:hypothetical protein CROQUDRAFT_650377 [Cronartium quercuum f. sp. fusiforme G11]|uniref:Uncharacterized protein n=1 Tax=Cronartium quercuum f. sp. fusiforme G11 TaxID=708437 RepID=A0A9P6NZK1_9BASI|nr:hypothetical protein CROQUDRAFT_650377 [Cronartium quercuum f. sp. fusiforme G11]
MVMLIKIPQIVFNLIIDVSFQDLVFYIQLVWVMINFFSSSKDKCWCPIDELPKKKLEARMMEHRQKKKGRWRMN